MKLTSVLLLLPLILISSGCQEKKIEVVTGTLDYARWKQWIQEPPQVILVSDIDSPTRELLNREITLFRTLVTPPPAPAPSSPVGDAQTQLDAIKASFPTQSKTQVNVTEQNTARTLMIDVPHLDRWSGYRNILNQTSLASMKMSAQVLERRIVDDLKLLNARIAFSGREGSQAKVDIKWINERMTPLVQRLKRLADGQVVTLDNNKVEKARVEWQQFEASDLPILKQVISQKTLQSEPIQEDGTFRLEGKGMVIAVAKVAGRDLYFPKDYSGHELRFFNVANQLVEVK